MDSLTAETRVAQPDGFADVRVTGGMTWGDAVAPSLDEKKPIRVALKAKDFRLAMIAPFVRSAVSELDGRLNADTTLDVKPGMKDGTMDGAIVLDKGLFETPAIGRGVSRPARAGLHEAVGRLERGGGLGGRDERALHRERVREDPGLSVPFGRGAPPHRAEGQAATRHAGDSSWGASGARWTRRRRSPGTARPSTST